jgi:hypothetical protein
VVIVGCLVVPFFVPAILTAVGDDKFIAHKLYRYGFHHTTAGSRAISRVEVDVLAPEALGAVVRISATLHLVTTVCAGKILNRALESFIG